MENPIEIIQKYIKLDDLEVPPFSKTSTCDESAIRINPTRPEHEEKQAWMTAWVNF